MYHLSLLFGQMILTSQCISSKWKKKVLLNLSLVTDLVKGNYLQKIRSRNISKFQFKLLLNLVYIKPDEVYQPFVEIDENLTIAKELYMTIASQL